MGGQRLDTALVARGLARSRTHAVRLIADERVRVAGATARKPATPVDDDTDLTVDLGDDWASRGAPKLVGALDAFAVDVAGRRALDAGASHGGFTDVLLRRGAGAGCTCTTTPTSARSTRHWPGGSRTIWAARPR
jgi:23S rRNA (cytidine1920-2'-O)/16S rRNA (cytidine1409-2'-O)-methyltransferase